MKPRIPLPPTTPALPKVKCPELRQLPKSPRPHGVTYRHQNPGTPTKLIAPHVNEPFLDPKHPAILGNRRKEPSMVSWNNSRSEAFQMVAAPKAMLFRPDVVHEPFFGLMFEKWEDKFRRLAEESSSAGPSTPPLRPWALHKGKGKETFVVSGAQTKPDAATETPALLEEGESLLSATERYVARREYVLSKAVPMSLMFATSKARMGGKPSYATKVKKRVRGAIALVVNQGAKVVEEQTQLEDGTTQVQKKVVWDLKEVEEMKEMTGGKGWVVPGWTYMVIPTMKLYRMPLTELIPEVREALQTIYERASKMERQWLKGPSSPPFRPSSSSRKFGGHGDGERAKSSQRPRPPFSPRRDTK